MLRLNLLPSSKNVTLTKSIHKYPFNTSSFHPKLHTRSYQSVQITKIKSHSNVTSFNKFLGYPFELPTKQNNHISRFPQVVKSASATPQESDSHANVEVFNEPNKTFKLSLVFGLWYFFYIVFNIYTKKVLEIFPFPWFLASFQLFCGSIWMLVLWSTKLQPCPKISKSFITALLGPALFHTIGRIPACLGFSNEVSFTQVFKSAEPVFPVMFSSLLGYTYPSYIWLYILPIVIGCSLAAFTEELLHFFVPSFIDRISRFTFEISVSVVWAIFICCLLMATISNIGFVLRNIYSKKNLESFKEVNGLNLYGWITIISFLSLFPVAIFVEGSQWVVGYHKAIKTIGKPSVLYLWIMLSGLFYHLYNQTSFQALDDISPLTFSVGNTMKSVVVIFATDMVFRNPVKPYFALGSAIAIYGTFLYSQSTTKKKAVVGKKN